MGRENKSQEDATGVMAGPSFRGVLRSLRIGTRNFVRVLRANPLTLFGFGLVVFISLSAVLVAIVPPVTALLGHRVSLTPYDPNELLPCPTVGNQTVCAQPPSAQHLFGTDRAGRDVFSRVLTALPLDLAIGFLVAGFALLVGGGLGLVAGFWNRPGSIGALVSGTIMRVTDVFLAFPSLVLALAIAAALGRGTVPCILAIVVTWWPYYVRLTRGEVLAVKHQPYVVAARAAGVPEWRILFRHVFRNILEPLVVYFTMDVGTVLVVFSTISFIGIGVPPDVPEWGNMIQAYSDYLLVYPWMVVFPGLAVFMTVLAFSLFGDGLRDILDPRSRRALTQAAVPRRIADAAPAATGAQG
ncbi:MAG TPA: ABC transporter permease [Thermoplasmata archaeon]